MSNHDALKKLREPFAEHQITQKPRGNTTLDFVGHAAITDRLLAVDPEWNWRPLALTNEGLPLFDEGGGLWIKLTVCGVVRLGYGNAKKKSQYEPGDREKEVIGDALRNAAMRFGAALDLWHKGDLHLSEPEYINDEQRQKLSQLVTETGSRIDDVFKYVKAKSWDDFPTSMYGDVIKVLEGKLKNGDRGETNK